MNRIHEIIELSEDLSGGFGSRKLTVREAQVADASSIQAIFQEIYGGKYPLEFGNNVELLKAEISDDRHYLWIVAEDTETNQTVAAMMFMFDPKNRMSKTGGGVVMPAYRKHSLGSKLLRIGVKHLTEVAKLVDVIYGTSRTVNAGPSRMTAEVGFRKMGLFPNAVYIEELEHLNLDIYLTENALAARRKKPYLFKPFYDIYAIARRQLSLERAYLVTEREPLRLSKERIPLELVKDEKKSIELFRRFSEQKRISNSFFPFHMPNWLLSTPDGGTDVFIWHGGVGKQASILGFRTDQVNIHDLLESVAMTLQRSGAAYVELLVDAYDYTIQQEAYTAKYIPSAYFPAMRLANDGLRDDYFVVSRTFQILDFTSTVVMSENYPYLEAYMRLYKELYLPKLGAPVGAQSKPKPKSKK